jgi:hypothetical protein
MASTSTPPLLSRSALAFFVREGWVIQRDVLDASQLAAARDVHERHLQESAEPPPAFSRDLCAEPALLDLLPRRCWQVAEQLLGQGTLVEPSEEPAAPDGPRLSGGGVAGGHHLRAIVSRHKAESQDPALARRPQHGCHVDAHPFSLGVLTYLHDVAPGAGAFSVWPRTHDRAFRCFPWQYSSREPSHAALAGDGGNEGVVKELVAAALRDISPVALHGRAGDVIYFHHRLLHAGGHNLTEETRTAVFYDFVKTPQLFRRNAALAEQPSENGDGPPPLDMWEDWSCETRAAAAAAAAVHAAPPMPKL